MQITSIRTKMSLKLFISQIFDLIYSFSNFHLCGQREQNCDQNNFKKSEQQALKPQGKIRSRGTAKFNQEADLRLLH